MGVVYSMAVGTIQKSSDANVEKVNLKNLKQYLQSIEHEKSVMLLCLDSCVSCNIYIDGRKEDELQGVFEGFLDDGIEIYRYDYFTGMQEQSKEVFFNEEGIEEDVCFSYTVDKKGIGEQVFVKFREKVYDYTLDSALATVYSSLNKAQEVKEELHAELVQ